MNGHQAGGALFDVERFRGSRQRQAEIRTVVRPTLVLGSTQPAGLVSSARAAADGVDVVRRRGGGGAVLLRPGDHVWVDAWIPRDDPLWEADVTASAAWVGEWWRAALGRVGVAGTEVHTGRLVPGESGGLVCFAGRGPGEVFAGDRKVVGLSQWRSREGTLFMTTAYSHWEPGPLARLLDLEPAVRDTLSAGLASVAVGLVDVATPGFEFDSLAQALLTSFPGWGSTPAGPAAVS